MANTTVELTEPNAINTSLEEVLSSCGVSFVGKGRYGFFGTSAYTLWYSDPKKIAVVVGLNGLTCEVA